MKTNILARSWAALAFWSLAASGCVVGPDYKAPETKVPPTFRSQPPFERPESVADLSWWELFNDQALQGLISTALANNNDIQVAIARIEQARAVVGIVGSQAYPQVGYQTEASGEQVFAPDSRGAGTVTFGTIGAALDAAWEFDVWGRIKRSTEAARANLAQQEDIRRGVLLILVSDVAVGYFRLIELDRELAIAQESVRVYKQTLDLFTLRFEAGRDNRLPVDRAQGAYDAGRARVEDLKRQIAQQENAISVLMGAHPDAVVRGRLLAEQTMPQTPLGATSDLLQRRPDIRAAEQAMIRANAEIGVAVAERFPRVGISGLLGLAAADVEGGGDGEGFGAWRLALAASGPIFTGGRLKAIYQSRQAFWDESVAQYRKTVLVAFQETADALAAQEALAQRRSALEAQVVALRRATELASARYDAGRASYFEVLEAQQELFPAEDALAQNQRDQLIAVVDLYKALGGGWKFTPEQWSRKS